jgi:hypothetical protein
VQYPPSLLPPLAMSHILLLALQIQGHFEFLLLDVLQIFSRGVTLRSGIVYLHRASSYVQVTRNQLVHIY